MISQSMKRILVLALFLPAIDGCTTVLTESGASMRLVQDQSDFNCSFVGTVSGANSMGNSTARDTDGAMNQVRNKAASLGANAVRIINVATTLEVTTVAAEALNCEF